MLRFRIVWFLSYLTVSLAGCGDFLASPDSRVELVGTAPGQVFLQYHKSYTGFNVLPSSIWSVDPDAGTSRRIRESTRQFGVEVEGDFMVTELVRDGEARGRIIAVQISTGKTIELHTRTLHLAANDPIIHGLSDGRAAVITPSGLLVFDLPNPAPAMTVELPEDTFALTAFKGELVLVSRGIEYLSEGVVLVDLATGASLEIPAPPGGHTFLTDAMLGSSAIAFSAVSQIDEDRARNQVLLFDIPTQSWRVLAEDEPYNSDGIPALLSVAGHDEERVVIEAWDARNADGNWCIESIDKVTAARTIIAQPTGSVVPVPVLPMLSDGRVYWVDPILPVLIVHDLQSGERAVVPLDLPG